MEAENIVIINLLYMGDLIFMGPFLRELRRNKPQAVLDLVVNANFADLFSVNPHLDHVFPFAKSSKLWQSLTFARRLRKNNYDLGINLHGNERSRLLLKMIGPRKIVRYRDKGHNKHMVDAYLDFLGDLNYQRGEGLPLELFMSAPPRAVLEKLETKRKIVGLNVGGTWPTKRWTARGFARLADGLKKDGFYLLFLGSKDDLPRVEEIIALMKEEADLVLTGQLDLLELAASIKACDLVISGDSGPIHMAAALGVPTLAIFGPSDPRKYHPYSENHYIIKRDLPCQPCGLHQCSHHSCLLDLTAEEVLAGVKHLVDWEN